VIHGELGSTGLRVSRIGLGLAALGRPAYINLGHDEDLGPERSVEALRGRSHAVLDAAYDLGIRYFDAARSYGLAEEFLASWLRARRMTREDVTVGSKWGYEYTGGWRLDAERHEAKDLSPAMFRRQLAETRALLGSELCLYQIHSATVESGVLEDEELLDELAALRSSGVAVGLTVTGTEQAATIERALERGGFDTVQATWNLLERSAEPALESARAAGLGVIVKEAVANGRLTARAAPTPLAEAARDLETTPDALAIAAALARPWADVILSGAATTAQLRSNLRSLEVPWSAETDARLQSLTIESGEYWRERGARPWN
jgi:aryl-alcohol dehydrogenase-like predicted oxidoreductase